VTINEWWSGDPGQRYWLEITDRAVLGTDLHAPRYDASGHEYWSYELVRYVNPGDVVFHWWKIAEGGPSIVGFSRAVGELQTSTIEWLAHGTVGRARGVPTRGPSWLMPLDDYDDLPQPIGQDRLRTLATEVRKTRDGLADRFGASLYFPFALSDKRPLRTAQGYLTKFPAQLVNVIPELSAIFDEAELANPQVRPGANDRRPSGAGWMQDPAARHAIERHAVDWTMRHFAECGYEVEDVGDWFSYDVRAINRDQTLHIEVKGTTGNAASVELTGNERIHDEGHARVLVVVDRIECTRQNRKVLAQGGRPRIWWDWAPEDLNLVATRYRYMLPDGWDSLALS